jgi:hypothetical protein
MVSCVTEEFLLRCARHGALSVGALPVARDEHKGDQFSAPEDATQIESGIKLQPLPGRHAILDALPKAFAEVALR